MTTKVTREYFNSETGSFLEIGYTLDSRNKVEVASARLKGLNLFQVGIYPLVTVNDSFEYELLISTYGTGGLSIKDAKRNVTILGTIVGLSEDILSDLDKVEKVLIDLGE